MGLVHRVQYVALFVFLQKSFLFFFRWGVRTSTMVLKNADYSLEGLNRSEKEKEKIALKKNKSDPPTAVGWVAGVELKIHRCASSENQKTIRCFADGRLSFSLPTSPRMSVCVCFFFSRWHFSTKRGHTVEYHPGVIKEHTPLGLVSESVFLLIMP